MPVLDAVSDLASLLEQWERDVNSVSGDPVPLIKRLAELIERETEAWYKMDPDPFDDRHPGRADPDCALGHLLKAVFKNEPFMDKLVNDYLTNSRDNVELQTIGCRLLLDLMPGLETSMVFQENEALVRKLVQWSETAAEPLSVYAVGLLGGAMEIQDIAANFKEKNAILVPNMLKKLHELKSEVESECDKTPEAAKTKKRPFANISVGTKLKIKQPNEINPVKCVEGKSSELTGTINGVVSSLNPDASGQSNTDAIGDSSKTSDSQSKSPLEESVDKADQAVGSSQTSKGIRSDSPPMKKKKPSDDLVNKHHDSSNSSWAEIEPYVIGTYKMWPLNVNMKQRLILQYLAPMGEYQELLSHVFEQHAMDLIFYYLDLAKNKDIRLAFEATKYLAALLCHKKFAIEFIQLGGVQKLLSIYRPSVAATGVSMCLYYLAYFEDAMERVCLLPHHVLTEMVSFVLWLLECSHESGRCHATMFFSMSFSFRIILELFDAQDGQRKLYNVISTLKILNIEEESNANLSEDEVFTSRQAARHVCVALKKYFEAHLSIKADQLRRSHIRSAGGSPVSEIPHYKACKVQPEVVLESMEVLLECLPLRTRWEPVSQFIKLGGPTLLLQFVAMGAEWNAYTGKAETMKNALEILAICAVVPKTQLVLCDGVPLPENVTSPAISVLLGLAEGEFVPDPDVQKAALSVVINCVCAPCSRQFPPNMSRFSGGSAKKKVNSKSGEDLLSKMWESLRANNGIMVLLKLMMTKTPVTEADAVRALACKALDGLARSDTIKQIISKLPLFNNGQLQMLMREPVLQDKRQEYLKFCKHATALIEKVSGKLQNTQVDVSLDRIRKADIVAQTKIVYQEKELLQLMHDHLMAKGLMETASALQREAVLPRCNTPPIPHPETPYLFSPSGGPGNKLLRQFSTPTSSHNAGSNNVCRSLTGAANTQNTPSGPIKINIINPKTASPVVLSQPRIATGKRHFRQKQDLMVASTSYASPSGRRTSVKQDTTVSLDKIVTEYLRKQHAGCHNPVVTCPPFSLLQPHMCPEPRHKSLAPANITSRVFRKHVSPPFGGSDGRKCDRKYVYSRFRPIKSYRDTEEDGCFSCSAFSADEQYLMLGTYAGELKLIHLTTGEETANYVCHTSPMNHCEPTRDGRLVLTCSSWGQPVSSLWRLGDIFDLQHGFDDDNYMEFSRQVQDRIIGTKEETAHIYDVGTGKRIMTLHDPDKANNYAWNRATFNPTDDLVLNDGVLWDINSGKPIHKFDKFNPNISGVFHPMGQEIIINSEVWDMRSFHLLHTVPGLDQCQIRFNHSGDVIYGAIHQNDDTDMEDDKIKSPFGSSFRTFDGTDYSNIATIDVKKNIFDLCTDRSDCYLAVVENLRNQETLSEESVCRLYEVGCLRDEDDDQDQDEEEDEGRNDDEDDDDDDDDDDDILASASDLESDLREDGDEDNESSPARSVSELTVSNDSGSINSDNEDEQDDYEESFSDSYDSDSENDDDVLFELSDISNGPWAN